VFRGEVVGMWSKRGNSMLDDYPTLRQVAASLRRCSALLDSDTTDSCCPTAAQNSQEWLHRANTRVHETIRPSERNVAILMDIACKSAISLGLAAGG
jgi:hypothetical protein